MQVFQRLQRLNICISHQVTATLVNILGSDHDAKVFQRKESLLDNLDTEEVRKVN